MSNENIESMILKIKEKLKLIKSNEILKELENKIEIITNDFIDRYYTIQNNKNSLIKETNNSKVKNLIDFDNENDKVFPIKVDVISNTKNKTNSENKFDYQNYKNIFSANPNQRFYPSRNFIVKYKEIDQNLIESHFKNVFKPDEYNILQDSINETLFCVFISFNNPKKLRLFHKLLKINNSIFPFSIENSARVCNILEKNTAELRIDKEDSEKNENLDDNIKNKIQMKKNNFNWVTPRKYIIKKSFISNTNNLGETFFDTKNRIKCFLIDILKSLESFDGNNFCNYLTNYITKTKIIFPNEYLINTIILNNLIEINQNFIDGGSDCLIEIISVDQKFEEIIKGIRAHFRCVS